MKELDLIFTVLLSSDVSTFTKREMIERVKVDWFIHSFHKDCFQFISDELANDRNPDTITAARYFQVNSLFKQGFTIMDFSRLLAEYKPTYIAQFYALCDAVEYRTAFNRIVNASKRLQNRITEGNGNLEELKAIMEEGIKATNLEIVHDETNTEVMESVLKRHFQAQSGNKIGIELGFPSLENKLIIEPVDMAVIAARPSMGKTAFGVSLLLSMCFQQGLKLKFFALEMSKEQMMRRIISQQTGIASWKIKYGKCNGHDVQQIMELQNHPNWNNFEIIEGTKGVDSVYYMASKWKMNGDCDLIIVDYLQKLTASRFKSKFEAVTYASNRLKHICQDFNIPVVALAQLSRANEQRGGDKRPILSDLRDSGEIEQDASVIGFLHRAAYYGYNLDDNGNDVTNKGEFIIAKNREGDLGTFIFDINPETIRWTDPNQIIEPQPTYEQAELSLNHIRNESGDDMPF